MSYFSHSLIGSFLIERCCDRWAGPHSDNKATFVQWNISPSNATMIVLIFAAVNTTIGFRIDLYWVRMFVVTMDDKIVSFRWPI
jgi:hypothetical protein